MKQPAAGSIRRRATLLAPQFLFFYDTNGGVAQFGYPITDAREEKGYLVQWTERQRLEYHPENAGTEYEVLLGLLGRELTKGLDGPRFSSTANTSTINSVNRSRRVTRRRPHFSPLHRNRPSRIC